MEYPTIKLNEIDKVKGNYCVRLDDTFGMRDEFNEYEKIYPLNSYDLSNFKKEVLSNAYLEFLFDKQDKWEFNVEDEEINEFAKHYNKIPIKKFKEIEFTSDEVKDLVMKKVNQISEVSEELFETDYEEIINELTRSLNNEGIGINNDEIKGYLDLSEEVEKHLLEEKKDIIYQIKEGILGDRDIEEFWASEKGKKIREILLKKGKCTYKDYKDLEV